MSDIKDYALGYSAQESRRLADQAAQIEEQTEDVFRRAGLLRGMHVLDIGSGVGDVSLLAARMVGSEGTVLGVERASSSVETARRRVAALELQNVSFEESDVAVFSTNRKFDALLGRFVLSYIPERAALLQRLAQYLNPGAIVVFQEMDLSQISQVPPSRLFTQVRRWVLEAFAAAGAELDMGTNLYSTFRRAGLPTPDMIAATPVVGGPSSLAYEQLVQALQSLLPVIERNNISDIADIGIDDLAARLRKDAVANDRVVFMSRIVGAWTRHT